MKVWLAGAGLLLFFALPAILTMTPALPRATAVQEPVTVSADPKSPQLRNLLAAEPSGLIIDLRFNGGGWTSNAEELSGFFIPWSPIVGWYLYHDTGGESWIRPRIKSDVYEGPVVILTNPSCRSTCDLFAKIMQQEDRAVLVGQNPEGAGITSRERVLPHGFKLYMSTPMEFVAADHSPIEGNPAQVDYEVAPTAADWIAGRDPALEKALSLLQDQNQ